MMTGTDVPWMSRVEEDISLLRDRGVYVVYSRNLKLGVYIASLNMIMGIRRKFDSEFLDMEGINHTARTVKFIEMLPDDIEAIQRERGPASFCQNCGKEARWTGPPAPAPWECDGNCEEVHPVAAPYNRKLMNYLRELEKIHLREK